ncbi:MAG: macro domain-containing protein [Sulfitobacter sp.]
MIIIFEHWRELFRSILGSFAAIFLPLEAFEVLDIGNISLSLPEFIAIVLVPGILVFLVDGILVSGFLKSEVEIPNSVNDTKIRVKFGDLFKEEGWKAIAVNDFFDSRVDEDLVSSKSLHGHVLNSYWEENRTDWVRQVASSLNGLTAKIEARSKGKGNKSRYPIGTTAHAIVGEQKFLFVSLGETNLSNNETSANAEMLISAVRGMIAKARAACSMEPLAIPLMGTGLARIGTKESVILDLIITAVLEESRNGRVTGEISIVLPERLKRKINLKNSLRNWGHGQ